MKRLIKKKLLLVALTTGLGLYGCSPSGGGTDVPSGFVAGILYTEDGKVAAYSVVHFVKNIDMNLGKTAILEKTALSDISLSTNERGEVVFDSSQQLEDGYYAMFGEAGALKSYSDSILFDNGVCDTIYDTLRPTGSLTGKVKLNYGDDKRLSWFFIPGKNIYQFTQDTSGTFTIENMAPGTYKVRFDTKLPLYLPFDTVLTIRSGCHDTIPYPIKLNYLIEVQALNAVYDTLMRSVTFWWNKIDSSIIGGYNLETDDGFSKRPRVLMKDTSVTLYVNDYCGARVSTLNLRDKDMENYTDWIYISAKDAISVKTISLPKDSVRTKGWALINDQFHVVQSSLFNPRNVSVCVYDKDGRQESFTSLGYGVVSDPLAVAARNDTLYILEKKNDDTLCIRPLDAGDTLACSASLTIPNNLGVKANLAFAPDGKVYVSQYLTTYVLNADGGILAQVDNIAPHFALSEAGLYTYVNGTSKKDTSSQLVSKKGIPSQLVRFELQGNSLLGVDTILYDHYGLIAEEPKIVASNNEGIVCCLVEQSLFINNYVYKSKSFNARLYLKDASMVVDLVLTDDRFLYMLYVNGRIDVADIGARIAEFEKAIDK